MRGLMVMTMAVLLCGAAAVHAQDRPLPEFQVVAPDSRPVASAAIAPQNRWLLIYVSPGCRSCDALVRTLPKWQSPALLARTVLVVGGRPEAARAWVETMIAPELSGIAWYGDPDGNARAALELPGAPVLVGVQAGQVEWQLGGVLNSPSALESVVRSWVEIGQ